MIINGKEVIISKEEVKKAVKIQDIIDKVEAIPDEAKRSATKEELQQLGGASLESFNNSMFDQLDYDSSLTSRKERYGTYNEMAKMDFIHKALEIVADDSTQKNNEGNVLDIYSDDDRIKARLEDLFLNRFDINNGMWSVIYDTCKLGDNFYEIVVDSLDKPKKIMDLKYLEAHQVERVEINDKLAFFTYRTEKKNNVNINTNAGTGMNISGKNTNETIYKLQPWQVLHFKLDDKESLPYGGSVLRAGVRTFNRIVLLEDISLVYRIARAPERRVFYIDVGNLNGLEAQRFLKKVKDSYRTQSFIDEYGKINKKANALSITQDIFIPVREGSQGTRIDTLQGGTALGGQDDLLKYFKDKIVRMLNIPPAYLGDDADKSRGSLAQLDIKFSRFIERIQQQITATLNKVASLDLYFAGFKRDDLYNFSLEFTPPSNIQEITEIEIANQRLQQIQTMISLNVFPTSYILKKVLKMTDKEIANLQLYKKLEMQSQAALQAGMGGEMGALPPDTGMGALPPPEGMPPEAGALPPPEGMPPEAAPAAPPAESTLVSVLGKDFLVENQADYFKVLKYIELNEDIKLDKSDVPFIFESIKRRANHEKIKKTSTQIEHLRIINEFGGIDFNKSEAHYFREVSRKRNGDILYEDYTAKIGQEER